MFKADKNSWQKCGCEYKYNIGDVLEPDVGRGSREYNWNNVGNSKYRWGRKWSSRGIGTHGTHGTHTLQLECVKRNNFELSPHGIVCRNILLHFHHHVQCAHDAWNTSDDSGTVLDAA